MQPWKNDVDLQNIAAAKKGKSESRAEAKTSGAL